jgi:hypothetical protein
MLNLVGLLDLDTNAYAVYAWLDEHALVLVAGDCQRCQEHLGRCTRLNLGDIVPLGRLGCEVGETEGSRQTAPDGLEIWAERLRLTANTSVKIKILIVAGASSLTIVLMLKLCP